MKAIVVLLLLAAPVCGAGISVTDDVITLGAWVSFPPPAPPATIKFELAREPGDAEITRIVVAIPNVTTDDSGRTWTIREADAATYGFDWVAFESAWTDPAWKRSWIGMNTLLLPDAKLASYVDRRLIAFDVDRIEIELIVYTHPQFDPGHLQIAVRTIGTGIIVAEPMSLTMLLFGVIVIIWHIAIIRC